MSINNILWTDRERVSEGGKHRVYTGWVDWCLRWDSRQNRLTTFCGLKTQFKVNV